MRNTEMWNFLLGRNDPVVLTDREKRNAAREAASQITGEESLHADNLRGWLLIVIGAALFVSLYFIPSCNSGGSNGFDIFFGKNNYSESDPYGDGHG